MDQGNQYDFSGLSRSEFLRLAGLGSGMLLMSGCGELWERQPVIQVDGWHKSVCRFCGTGCGIQIGTNKGKVVDVRGDKYAHNRGRLCIKGIINRDILYAPDRNLYPMIRTNGKLLRASWDDAMGLVAEKFREAIATSGPDSVGFYGSGQLFTEESYTASKLFKAGIRTNNVDGNPRLCMASPAFGYTSVFGKDEPMGCYDDIDHADCFFLAGSNTANATPSFGKEYWTERDPIQTLLSSTSTPVRLARHWKVTFTCQFYPAPMSPSLIPLCMRWYVEIMPTRIWLIIF